MIDKILSELGAASVWMPTQVITDRVGARSASNVALHLQSLEKSGRAVSRTRFDLGVKLIEWRHADNPNVADFEPSNRSRRKKSLDKDDAMPTDKECCNAAKVIATTAGAEFTELQARVKMQDDANLALAGENMKQREEIHGLQFENDSLKSELEYAKGQRNAWREMASMFGKETPVELGAFISELQNRITGLEEQVAIPDAPKARQQHPITPRRPFSTTGLLGYHAGAAKVTLFLDRKLNARSVTLPADKLMQLAEMAGR